MCSCFMTFTYNFKVNFDKYLFSGHINVFFQFIKLFFFRIVKNEIVGFLYDMS